MSHTEQLDALRHTALECNACPLWHTRTNVVFGVGDPDAKVLLIGEAPGENEDKEGEPFVGRAGVLLDKMLAAIDLSRERGIYITNIIKCRPPRNRDPLPDEQTACLPYLREQTRILRPSVIVCLGRVAAKRLISPDFLVTKQHGEWFFRAGVQMMGTYHPAALLRNPNNKPDAMADFFGLREKMAELGL